MTGCNQCGTPCAPYSLCRTHRLERRHGDDPPDTNPDDAPDGSLPHQCLECGEIWDTTMGAACPECGATHRRYVGPLSGPTENDDGAMIVDSEAVLEEVGD